MKHLFRMAALLLTATFTPAQAQTPKAPVFLYAGQSNADGREYVQNLPDYMKVGTAPYAPFTHLKYANICGNPTAKSFGSRTLEIGTRYAFCDVANYWIDQASTQDFYAIKCAYGGTAIAPGVTAEKLPIWYADATWMQTHNAYKGDDLTQEAYKNNNSLTKNLTEGFASLVDGTLAALDNGYDVKAILWHQGESDRNAANSYYDNFKTMIAYMRQAIYEKTGDEQDLQLPFIFGTICHQSTQYNATVERAQLQVAKDVPEVYYIDMSDVTLRSDNLHFDGPATEYLGKMMYNKLVQLGLVEGEQVAARQDVLWVAPFSEISAYVRERNSTFLRIVNKGKKVIVTPLCTLNPDIFQQPLTLIVNTDAVKEVHQGSAKLHFQRKNGQTLIDFLPNSGDIIIEKAQRSDELSRVYITPKRIVWTQGNIKRDRAIWLGDMHPEVQTIMTVFGMNDIVPKTLDWMKNAARIDEMVTEGKVDVHRDYGDYCYLSYRHSLCHGWAPGPTAWLSRHVLGVEVVDAGCRTLLIAPHLGSLLWAEGTVPTPFGPVNIRHENGSISSKINAPAGVKIIKTEKL